MNPTQDTRLLYLTTPLGADVLLIHSLEGFEGLSQLFSYSIDAFASNEQKIDYSKLIGQPACVRVALDRSGGTSESRYFHGLIQTVARGARGYTSTGYRLQLVPHFWVLSRTTQSRIFQQKSVPDILKAVLANIKVKWEIQGTFEPREYCTQYRESDFAFASRLMEEEGLFYYFTHTAEDHTMVIANTPTSHKELPVSPTLHYDPDVGGYEEGEIIYAWEKMQTLRSGKVTLRDHHFQLPHKPLEAQELIADSVAVGTVNHMLRLGGNEALELYDYPGGYATRFDGVNKSGGEQAGELQKIYSENGRMAKLRMQEEAVHSIASSGSTTFYGIIPGYRFKLERHYEDDGIYVITSSRFLIPQMGQYSAGVESNAIPPDIAFTCIPFELPYLPQQLTPKPSIHGTQTAVVTGPSGEEIFTDSYGRVKVQFFWDRRESYNSESSCWVRCGFPWAGKNFGFISIPRIGHEVVVAFEEGDPDKPLVVGSVYNADTMPPWTLPDNRTQSGIQTRTEKGGSANLNVLRFEDKKDAEHIFLHAEKDFHTRVKKDTLGFFGQDFHRIVERDLFEALRGEVHRLVEKSIFVEVKGNTQDKVAGNTDLDVTGNVKRKVGGNIDDQIQGSYRAAATMNFDVKALSIAFESSTNISFKVGGSEICVDPSGVTIKGAGGVFVTGPIVNINSGPGSPAKAAKPAQEARVTTPKAPAKSMEASETGVKSYSGSPTQNVPIHPLPPTGTPPAAAKVQSESKDVSEKTHYIEVELKDEDNLPVPGERFEVLTPEGTRVSGVTDEKGYAKVDGVQPGEAKVYWTGRDKTVVK